MFSQRSSVVSAPFLNRNSALPSGWIVSFSTKAFHRLPLNSIGISRISLKSYINEKQNQNPEFAKQILTFRAREQEMRQETAKWGFRVPLSAPSPARRYVSAAVRTDPFVNGGAPPSADEPLLDVGELQAVERGEYREHRTAGGAVEAVVFESEI